MSKGYRLAGRTMSETIGQRKADHLALCATEDVGFQRVSTLFENVRLVHDALPDLDEPTISTTTILLGKRLAAPMVIAAMTGGTEEAGRVNRDLAQIAEEKGLAFGLGSQRAMHSGKGAGTEVSSRRGSHLAASYRVRDVAPTALVFGNIGVVQARDMSTTEVRDLALEVGADALCVHLNPAMELIQPGGDRDFGSGLETIERLVADLGLPVIVKETGCGLSPDVGRRLRNANVQHLDVSGAGGTSWVGVEARRAQIEGDLPSRDLGTALWDWGIPTAASVALISPLGFKTLIATGGVASGVDVARALVLGASAAGIARPLLKALHQNGRTGAVAAVDAILRELRAVMLLTGSRDLRALSRAKRVIVGELSAWIEQLSHT